jgi:serine/threonine-protein kinase
MNPQLTTRLRHLRLSGMVDALPGRVAQAEAAPLPHLEFLELLVEDELARRADRLFARRLKQAGITAEKTLADFEWTFNPKIPKAKIAAAHAGLAETYTELSGYYVDPREAMPRAKDAAETAIRLDATLSDAHAALGYVKLVYDWDGPAAEKALLHALHLNPSLATARLNYAAYLTTQARNEDARQEIRRAVDLDPLSVRTHAFGGMLLNFTRAYDEALELTRRGLELEPDSGFTVAVQGVAYAEQGRYDEAVERMQRAAELDDSLTILALQAHVLALAGRSAQAAAVLRHVEQAAKHRYFCPYEIGTVYVSLGDHDTAAALFRKGTRERADCMAWLGVEPWIDTFRSDVRYPALLRDIGLSPVPR